MRKTTAITNVFNLRAAAVAVGLLAIVPPHAYPQTNPASATAPAATKDSPAPVIASEPLAKFLVPLLKTDRRIAAAFEDLEAARQRASAARGDWFPTLKVTSWAGRERIDNLDSADTALNAKETDVTVTQLITDFGKTDSKVARAQIAAEQADITHQLITQTLVNDAASAYANLYRASIQLRYSIESVENIAKQLAMEQARLKAGTGVATDVLQVQAQLSAAQARQIRTQAQLQIANSRFFNLFGSVAVNIGNLARPVTPIGLPSTLDEAIKQASETNLSIKNAVFSTQSARESVRGDRADSYFPKFEAIYDNKSKDNVSGIAGKKTETLIKGQMSWSFNLGGGGIHTVRAAEHSVAAAGYRQTDAEKNAREQVSVAWQGLSAARQTSLAFSRQVEAVSKFLDLARKERALGSRSLLDILNGETTLLNAQSDAIAADIDELLSSYALLQALGKLSEGVVLRL